MNVRKSFKIIGLILLISLVAISGWVYIKLKEVGIISRQDYDHVSPEIPSMSRPSVLVLNKTNGFIHVQAIPAANDMLARIAETKGWDIYITDNAASHSQEHLEQFDLVVWNNVSGDVLLEGQRSALKKWIEKGGGWVGLHASGGDFSYDWSWYSETLIGAQFVGHTMNPQFQDAELHVVDPSLPLTSHLSSPWLIKQEEWYAFDSNPREKGYEIILTIDEASYITTGENFLGMNDEMEGEHPLAWRHELDEGRVFYSAIGHQADTYLLPEYEELISKAMSWAMTK